MFCKACGSRLPDGASFCATCGVSVAAATGSEAVPPVDLPVDAPVDRPVDQPTLVQPTEIRPPSATSPPSATNRGPAIVPPPSEPNVPPPSYTPPPPSYTAMPPATYAATPPAPSGYPAYPPQTPSGFGGPPPRGNRRLGLWLGIVAAVIVLAGAVAATWLLVRDRDHTETLTSSVSLTTPTTSGAGSTSTSSSTSSTARSTTSSSTTTPAPLTGTPGDSLGEWVEMDIPNMPSGAYALSLSDRAMLLDVQSGGGYTLYAYMFDTREFIQLPIDATDFGDEDVDGNIAVWWEGNYDQATDKYSNEHVYAYPLPDGPKVELAGESNSLRYPQISGSWVTWVEEEPFADKPDEYSLLHIYGVTIDKNGKSRGDPVELVPEATAFTQGDYSWAYSLCNDHLAWENATAVGAFDPGVYRMDLNSRQPVIVGTDVWRPSLGDDTLVYTDAGLVTTPVDGGQTKTLDPRGDFASAASTFAVYFRSVDDANGTTYEIVARGFTGAYEQVLGKQSDAPWLSPYLAASDHHVGYIQDGVAHVFEWQGAKVY